MAFAHNPKIVTDGLVLCLDAANPKSYPGSGTTWTDLSGNGNDGTLINGVGYDNANNGSLIFDGTNDGIQTSLTLDKNDITMSIWFNIDTIRYSTTLIFNDFEGASQDWIAITIESGIFKIMVDTNGTRQDLNGPTPTTGKWYNIVVVRQDTGLVSLYVDGALSNSFTHSVSGTIDGIQPFRIGYNYISTQYFDGKISQASIYNRALTADEIQQNYTALRGRYGI